MTKKVYLGDAVYASFDGMNVTLTTEDGVRATNVIVLEPEVYRALTEFVEALRVVEDGVNLWGV